jgi:AcrR family transcriptional regulator
LAAASNVAYGGPGTRLKRGGVTRAALFYHFRDKQALHDAVIEDIFGALVARLDETFSMPTSIAARIERSVEVWVDAIVARPALARLILRYAAEAEERPAQSLFPAAERLLRMGWSLFERAREWRDQPRTTTPSTSQARDRRDRFLSPRWSPRHFDPLAPEQAAHKRDALRTARHLLGLRAAAREDKR